MESVNNLKDGRRKEIKKRKGKQMYAKMSVKEFISAEKRKSNECRRVGSKVRVKAGNVYKRQNYRKERRSG